MGICSGAMWVSDETAVKVTAYNYLNVNFTETRVIFANESAERGKVISQPSRVQSNNKAAQKG
jgi:hypothetical protein